MLPIPDFRPGTLDEPDNAVLLRMTRLAGRVFHVPIAYVELLGPDLAVTSRIGSGSQHWEALSAHPIAYALKTMRVWRDPSGEPAPGFVRGDIRFAATAPLRSNDGLELGLLVIADVKARADFWQEEREILDDLASMLTRKLGLRVLAGEARELAFMVREADDRFRSIANSVPVMIMYAGVDGGSSFVNQAWLKFTGRTLAEGLGDSFADAFHPDHRARVLANYWTAFRDREPTTEEFPMRRSDGEYRWVQARGVPRFLDNGEYTGYVGCFTELESERVIPVSMAC